MPSRTCTNEIAGCTDAEECDVRCDVYIGHLQIPECLVGVGSFLFYLDYVAGVFDCADRHSFVEC
jgi:hypothetical protein